MPLQAGPCGACPGWPSKRSKAGEPGRRTLTVEHTLRRVKQAAAGSVLFPIRTGTIRDILASLGSSWNREANRLFREDAMATVSIAALLKASFSEDFAQRAQVRSFFQE